MFNPLKLAGLVSGGGDLSAVLPLLEQYGVTVEPVTRDHESLRSLLKGVGQQMVRPGAEVLKLSGEFGGRRMFALVISEDPAAKTIEHEQQQVSQ